VSIVSVYRKLVAVVVVVLSGLGALAATSVAPAAGAARRAPTGDAFYVPPQPLTKAKPGTVIRSTPIADAPAGARAWKILYHSRTVGGKDIAVSGVVVAPTGTAPRAGRVIVTWAHGATGLADMCAPSKQTDIASGSSGASIEDPRALIPMLQTLLDAGYVVAATDYEGLGTPGLHPFLVGESEGRSVLDAARAARGLKAAAANSKVLVLGHSQGGQAALFAGELATSYAPQLHLLGVATEAPIMSDIEHTLPIFGTVSAANPLMLIITEAFHAAYPQFDPAALLTPDALAQAPILEQNCFSDIVGAYRSSPDLALTHSPLDIPALATILHTNSVGNRPAGAPLLVVQGTADADNPQLNTDLLVAKTCAAGDTVDYRLYTGADHLRVFPAAATDVAAWFADRVGGAPATSTCKAP
jgi:alpha/beta superfamily hydrolase